MQGGKSLQLMKEEKWSLTHAHVRRWMRTKETIHNHSYTYTYTRMCPAEIGQHTYVGRYVESEIVYTQQYVVKLIHFVRNVVTTIHCIDIRTYTCKKQNASCCIHLAYSGCFEAVWRTSYFTLPTHTTILSKY